MIQKRLTIMTYRFKIGELVCTNKLNIGFIDKHIKLDEINEGDNQYSVYHFGHQKYIFYYEDELSEVQI